MLWLIIYTDGPQQAATKTIPLSVYCSSGVLLQIFILRDGPNVLFSRDLKSGVENHLLK